jgi:putative DNA primase/helicase
VLLVHHAGKGGAQRGTSSREDVLDTSISLKHPSDYVSSEGCRLEVHYEKARGLFGTDADPFEAKMELRDGKAIWTMRDIEDANRTRARALLEDGMSLSEIADELGISKTSAHRLKRQLENEA